MRHVPRVALAAVTLALAAAPANAQKASAPANAQKASADAAPLKKAPSSDAAPPKKTVDSSDPIPRRGFNVVLLVGDVMGPGYPKPIPDAALKALSDMRDFLPYKGYNLLDTQWIVGGTSSPAVTRLRGLDEQDYELELRASPLPTPGAAALDRQAMSVRFVLRDVDTGSSATESGRAPVHPKEAAKSDLASMEIAREIFQLERERTDLEMVVTKGRSQVEIGMANHDDVKRSEAQLSAVNRRINELKQSLSAANVKAAGRPVIDTSFRMDDGETVVVGTSKVKGGGKALIALLTATSDRSKGSTK
jgi:hypothetical protein